MSWIKYKDAIKKNITGRPTINEYVAFEEGSRNKKRFLMGHVRKISNHTYLIEYYIPDEFRSFFSKDTNNSWVGLSKMYFYSGANNEKDSD